VANPELPVPDKAGATVLDRFAVDQIADLTWRGRDCDPLGGRMYGGTLAARLLAAARAATVGPPATSGLDIHFLQPADGGLPSTITWNAPTMVAPRRCGG
jgi:acyl-CoA thioesterase